MGVVGREQPVCDRPFAGCLTGPGRRPGHPAGADMAAPPRSGTLTGQLDPGRRRLTAGVMLAAARGARTKSRVWVPQAALAPARDGRGQRDDAAKLDVELRLGTPPSALGAVRVALAGGVAAPAPWWGSLRSRLGDPGYRARSISHVIRLSTSGRPRLRDGQVVLGGRVPPGPRPRMQPQGTVVDQPAGPVLDRFLDRFAFTESAPTSWVIARHLALFARRVVLRTGHGQLLAFAVRVGPGTTCCKRAGGCAGMSVNRTPLPSPCRSSRRPVPQARARLRWRKSRQKWHVA